jgi:hypothetical protein
LSWICVAAHWFSPKISHVRDDCIERERNLFRCDRHWIRSETMTGNENWRHFCVTPQASGSSECSQGSRGIEGAGKKIAGLQNELSFVRAMQHLTPSNLQRARVWCRLGSGLLIVGSNEWDTVHLSAPCHDRDDLL